MYGGRLVYSVIMMQCSFYPGVDYLRNAPYQDNVVYEGCNVFGRCQDELCDWYTKGEEAGYPSCYGGTDLIPIR